MITSNLSTYPPNSTKAKVEFYEGSTLVQTCTCDKQLSQFTLSREGEKSKFFGFGVCHKVDMKLIDLEKVIRLYQGYKLILGLGDGTDWDNPCPDLEVTEVKIDKKSGDITVTAYDVLYNATQHTFAELGLGDSYTLNELAQAIATLLGISLYTTDSSFEETFTGNYEGTESLRDVLNHIAEVTQTIYFINSNNQLRFRRLEPTSVKDYYRKDYYEFEIETPKIIKGICNVTELESLISEDTSITTNGVIQYIKENPLWALRTDLATLLDTALSRVVGTELVQFDLDWSGDYLLEIGDYITVHYEDLDTEENDDITHLYVLNDVISYVGTLNETTDWEWTDTSAETDSNSTNIGDKINQTYARVDKLEKNITLFVGDAVDEVIEEKGLVTEERVSQLELTTEGVITSVSTTRTSVDQVDNKVDSLEEGVNKLTNEVNLKVSAEDVSILVNQTLQEGVDKVVTATKKYTFDDTGLNVSSSSSQISTVITEDGMRVKRGTNEVLIANNEGVKAEDLHATTFLLIGNNSRLETYQTLRTACFWIGG